MPPHGPRDNKVVATIPLGGSPEFPAVDSAAGRVYINLEDKSEVAVIDTAKHAVTARWPLTPGEEPTGIALDAAHHRLFAACHNKMMTMIDTESGKAAKLMEFERPRFGLLRFARSGKAVVYPTRDNGVDNLWLQPWTGPWSAKVKDRLERKLQVVVCAGQLSLRSAREATRLSTPIVIGCPHVGQRPACARVSCGSSRTTCPFESARRRMHGSGLRMWRPC